MSQNCHLRIAHSLKLCHGSHYVPMHIDILHSVILRSDSDCGIPSVVVNRRVLINAHILKKHRA